jgi:hypothetical protein
MPLKPAISAKIPGISHHFSGIFPPFPPKIDLPSRLRYHRFVMAFPIKTCVVCGDEFELRPGKPGFANRCPSCSEPESDSPSDSAPKDAIERQNEAEANAERRRVIRDMLYRKDS